MNNSLLSKNAMLHFTLIECYLLYCLCASTVHTSAKLVQ